MLGWMSPGTGLMEGTEDGVSRFNRGWRRLGDDASMMMVAVQEIALSRAPTTLCLGDGSGMAAVNEPDLITMLPSTSIRSHLSWNDSSFNDCSCCSITSIGYAQLGGPYVSFHRHTVQYRLLAMELVHVSIADGQRTSVSRQQSLANDWKWLRLRATDESAPRDP